LNPDDNVLCLIGSKEGIAHLCQAYLDPGDFALGSRSQLSGPFQRSDFGGRADSLHAAHAGKQLPAGLQQNSASVLKRAKIMFLCYPNNPTAAVGRSKLL
jgi:LL-diaminopimelate aminotransferase